MTEFSLDKRHFYLKIKMILMYPIAILDRQKKYIKH
jgi:hypothetical protein